MKIKITNKKSGLTINKIYDLCDMSAKTLIRHGYAVLSQKEKTDDTENK